MKSDKVLELIYEALKFHLGEKGRFTTLIDSVEMSGDSLIIKTLESSEDCKNQDDVNKTQAWRLLPEDIGSIIPRAEGDIALPLPRRPETTISKIDKNAKFWQNVFDAAIKDQQQIQRGDNRAVYVGKIGLIKAFRALTGDGLKESKDAIDGACRLGIYIPMRDPGQTYEHWVVGTLPVAPKKRR